MSPHTTGGVGDQGRIKSSLMDTCEIDLSQCQCAKVCEPPILLTQSYLTKLIFDIFCADLLCKERAKVIFLSCYYDFIQTNGESPKNPQVLKAKGYQ